MLVRSLFCLALVACGAVMPTGFHAVPEANYKLIDERSDGTREIELRAPTTIGRFSLQPGSRVHFNNLDDPDWITTKSPVTSSGIDIPAGSKIFVESEATAAGLGVGTYRLSSVVLGANHRYGAVDFVTGDEITFNPDNTPESAVLAGKHTYGGKEYGSGATLMFNRLGEVTEQVTHREKLRAEHKAEMCRVRCADLQGDGNARCYNRCTGNE